KARHGDTSVELATLSAELDGALLLKSGKAARLAITYELPNTPDAPAAPAAAGAGDPAPPPLPVVLPSAKRKGRAPPPTPPAPVDTTPLLPLPDVHALRKRAGTIAATLADRMPEGGLLSVDGLELQLGVRGDKIALGPGPLTIERTHANVRVAF